MPRAYSPQEVFADGWDPPDERDGLVHITFWIRLGRGRGAKKVPVARVALSRRNFDAGGTELLPVLPGLRLPRLHS